MGNKPIWTPATLWTYFDRVTTDQKDHVNQQIEGLIERLDERLRLQTDNLNERFATQTKAVDKAFTIQETALQTAYETAGKNLETALSAAKEAAALLAGASEKRFESVNEFRGQLADQAATFETRTSAAARDERIERIERTLTDESRQRAERDADIEGRLTSRLDIALGTGQGETAQKSTNRLDNAQILGIAGFSVALMSLIAVVAIAFFK